MEYNALALEYNASALGVTKLLATKSEGLDSQS